MSVASLPPSLTSRVSHHASEPTSTPAAIPTGTETTAGVPMPCISAAPKPNAETKPPMTALEKTSPASTSKTPSKRSPSTSETATSARPTKPMTKNVVIAPRSVRPGSEA